MGLQYNKIATNDGEILLSPSSIAQMFDNEGKWYSTYIKGEDKFSGNDNTYLGTLLHNRIEQYYNVGWIDKEEELKYLESVNAVDQWAITDSLEKMYKAWVEQYGKKNPKPANIEIALSWKPAEDVVLGGSIDAITGHFEAEMQDGEIIDVFVGDTILDWKTSTKSKSSIADYKMQLYAYALICRNNGITINNVGIVNIVKPTTKGEVKVNVLIEPIDEDYMAWFIEQLKLKIKKIRFTKENPELESMLWMNNPYSYRQ